MKIGFLSILLFLSAAAGYGQNINSVTIDTADNGKSFSVFLSEIESESHVDFIYDEESLGDLTVLNISQRMRVLDYLQDYLVQYRTVKVADNIVFIVDKALGDEYGRRKENYITLKSNSTTLKGTVTDGSTNEPIIGCQVFIPKLNQGTLTGAAGEFDFKVTDGIFRIDIQYIGYETSSFIVGFSRYGQDSPIAVTILPAAKELEGVVISAERVDKNVSGELSGVEQLSIETIKTLPTFLGVVDPIKSLTTLPGVSTVGELSAGFNVRGGESGQNLILQDGATIYNPSHLFGFFSAFNPDMLSDVVLYKGGGPANFGGRVSSVLNVKLRNGDAGRHKVTGGAGLVSSRLMVEGPIVRNKSSYLFGGRLSYTNWLLKATDNIALMNSSAKFYDLTGKIFHTINADNLITFSGYKSYDNFRLATDSTFSWGTLNGSLSWDHNFNEHFFSTMNLAISNYFSEIHHDSEIDKFKYSNAIKNLSFNYDVTYKANEASTFLIGLSNKNINLEPGKLKPEKDGNNVLPVDINDQHAVESAAYIQGNFEVSGKLALSGGLRYSHFLRLGQDNIYTYDYESMNGRYPAIADTVNFTKGEVIKKYHGFEPRFSLRYLLSPTASLKASYYRGYQYLHLISNTASATPQDYWVTSGKDLRPQIGDQFSVGIFKNLKNDLYELSVEAFYKEVSNTIDYIDGADITLNPMLEAGLAQGEGLAYGVELLLKKNQGLVNGWLSYTFSRSFRRFDDGSGGKEINQGEYYPATYDQPHNLSLIFNYRLSPRSIFSTNFSYSTGRPITIPVSKFSYDGYLAVLNYSDRNEYRIPDYHRLDVSVSIEDKPSKTKKFLGEWVFSVFNVYSRNNAYSIFFDKYGKASKLSVLGSIFPSVSYNFSF